jgi:outer membrane receptor protein involved in Fe transport
LNNAWQLNDTIGYKFHYNEQLFALYFQYNINREKWDLTAGLRAEETTGNVIDITETDKRFNLFPAVFFNYFLTESQTLGFSYSRRIQRISYFKLIPQRWYSSQYSIMEGNPDLKPNIHNNIELNYNILNKYSFSLGYYWNNNTLSSYSRSQIIDNKTVFVNTYKDGVKNKNFNFNAYIPITFTKWWSSVNQIYGNYNEYKSADFDYKNFSYGFFTQHTFLMFWKLKSEILYRFYSPEKTAYSEDDPYHLLNFSIQRNFLSDKLTIKLSLDQILCYQKPATKTITPTVESINKMYGKKIPSLSFTITYSFNKGKTRQMPNITDANAQEKNRAY